MYLKGERDKTKARDRYMITDVKDIHYEIRKFTKSQFRSKTYLVHKLQCYKVKPSILVFDHDPGPIRGLLFNHDEDDHSSVDVGSAEEATVHVPSDMKMNQINYDECSNDSLCVTPSIPPEISEPLRAEHDCSMSDDKHVIPEVLANQNSGQSNVSKHDCASIKDKTSLRDSVSQSDSIRRKSGRKKCKPKWLSSGDWIVEIE